jgi:serine phosphatase RsbU (regulator of sigma subunit)
MNAADEPYSIERIREQLSGAKATGPDEIGQGLLEDVRQYVGESEQRDDISLVVYQRDPE